MSGYVENAIPEVTATIYRFNDKRLNTGQMVAALVQQYARENDKKFIVARQTDSTGDSYVIGLTGKYGYQHVAVVPSLGDRWMRPGQPYDMLQIVSCEWHGTLEVGYTIAEVMETVSGLAYFLQNRLSRSEPVPSYRHTDFSTAPNFDPRIYLEDTDDLMSRAQS